MLIVTSQRFPRDAVCFRVDDVGANPMTPERGSAFMYTISPLGQAEQHATMSAERIAPFYAALLGADRSRALFWADLTYVNTPNIARKLNDTVDDRILNAVLNDQTVNADEQSEF